MRDPKSIPPRTIDIFPAELRALEQQAASGPVQEYAAREIVALRERADMLEQNLREAHQEALHGAGEREALAKALTDVQARQKHLERALGEALAEAKRHASQAETLGKECARLRGILSARKIGSGRTIH